MRGPSILLSLGPLRFQAGRTTTRSTLQFPMFDYTYFSYGNLSARKMWYGQTSIVEQTRLTSIQTLLCEWPQSAGLVQRQSYDLDTNDSNWHVYIWWMHLSGFPVEFSPRRPWWRLGHSLIWLSLSQPVHVFVLHLLPLPSHIRTAIASQSAIGNNIGASSGRLWTQTTKPSRALHTSQSRGHSQMWQYISPSLNRIDL